MATTYALPNVKPFVRAVGNELGNKFGIPTIGGWRASAKDMGGHPAGLALDFQVGTDKSRGDLLAAYVQDNAAALRVKYIIWQQRIWYPGRSWQNMEHRSGDRAGYDPNHKRHIHVSFNANAADVDKPDPLPGINMDRLKSIISAPAGIIGNVIDGAGNLIGNAGEAVTAPMQAVQLLTSGELWKRVGLVIGGGGLIVLGVVLLVMSSKEAQGAAKTALAAVPHPAAKVASVASSAATKS